MYIACIHTLKVYYVQLKKLIYNYFMDDEKKGKKMSSEQGNLLLEVWVFFLHKIQSKDNT